MLVANIIAYTIIVSALAVLLVIAVGPVLCEWRTMRRRRKGGLR